MLMCPFLTCICAGALARVIKYLFAHIPVLMCFLRARDEMAIPSGPPLHRPKWAKINLGPNGRLIVAATRLFQFHIDSRTKTIRGFRCKKCKFAQHKSL